MRFEARKIQPYSVPVKGSELKVGEVYFRISFIDEYLHYPVMDTLVFIGRDLDLEIIDKDPDFDESKQVYFQDYESYAQGIRIDTLPNNNEAVFSSYIEDELNGVFEFERALDQLMWCSLRRRGLGEA